MASLDSAGLRAELFGVLFALFVGLLLSSFVAAVRAVCAAAREACLRSTCAVVRFAGSGTRRAGGDWYVLVRLVQVKALQDEQAEQLRVVTAEHEATMRTLLLRIARLEDKVADACLDSPLRECVHRGVYPLYVVPGTLKLNGYTPLVSRHVIS